MPKSATKPSTPKLSDVARHVVAPKGAVSTGWPAVEAKCRELGILFRWWQVPIGRIILAKRADGKYATTIGGTGLSIPRQVGKTYLVGAIIFALCLLRPNLTVIWTAHRLRTAEETFGKMQKFARRKRIAPHILKIVLGSGEEEIQFRNGSRILFGARERGFGRGFDEVDVVVYDEGQILTESALDDMIPATNQCRQPEGALLLFMGTPPRPNKDPGEVFTRMRTEALSGEDDDTAWVEFGADPLHKFTPLPAPLTDADWKQIAKANPSFPEDTPREAILRMRKKLGEDSFLREGAGVWDEDSEPGVLPGWSDRKTDEDPPAPAVVALAVSPDRAWASIAASSLGDVPHVGAVMRGRGTAWVLDELCRLYREHGTPVVIDGKGAGENLIEPLEREGVQVITASTEDVLTAQADLVDAVASGAVCHGGYAELDRAIEAAGFRKVGKRQAFAAGGLDISMLEAAALAYGLREVELEPSAYAF